MEELRCYCVVGSPWGFNQECHGSLIHFGEIPVGAQRGMGHVGQRSGQAGGHPGQQWPGAWTEMGSGGGEIGGSGSGSILKGVSTGLPGWDVDVRKGIQDNCMVLGLDG